MVLRFSSMDNNVTKHKSTIPKDMTNILVPHEFNLQATVPHHVPSKHSGHYTTSVNWCNEILW